MARFEKAHLFPISLFFLLSWLFIFSYVEESYIILGSVLYFLNSCCSSFSVVSVLVSSKTIVFLFPYLSALSSKYQILD